MSFGQVWINVILQVVRLHFLSFDVETDNDKVIIQYDEDHGYNGPHVETFSGTSRPSDVVSAGNVMFVTFSTDATNTQGGFKVEYTTSTSM